MKTQNPPIQQAVMDQFRASLGDHTETITELGLIFARAGHEIALVGGPVRDAFLGRQPAEMDLDFTTSARPDDIEKLVEPWADTTWAIGKEFGTIGMRKRGVTCEITTYRHEAYEPSSRKPAVQFGDSLDGDLTRRDFTVNAMAVSVPDFVLHDPCGGLRDLVEQRLRTPAPPAQSFDDDPLRIMRAARFVAQLGFTVAADTYEAMRDMAPRLEIVSAERVQAELVKLVCGEHARRAIDVLTNTGVADVIIPEIPAMRLEIDEHHRHKDVYEHSLTVMQQAIELESAPGVGQENPNAVEGPDFILRFAALMHDIGKPRTRRHTAGGGVSFHHHEVVGAKMTAKRMKALRFDSATTKQVARLVELHLRFHGYGEQKWTDSAVRRYVNDAGDLLPRLHLLTRADCTTRNKRKAARLAARYDDLERRIAELSEAEELAAVRPDLDGREIMEILSLSPGPHVGKAYKFLLNERLEHGPLGRERAVEVLQAWWARQPESGAEQHSGDDAPADGQEHSA